MGGNAASKELMPLDGDGLRVFGAGFVNKERTVLHFKSKWLKPPTYQGVMKTMKNMFAAPAMVDQLTQQTWLKISGSNLSDASGNVVCRIKSVPQTKVFEGRVHAQVANGMGKPLFDVISSHGSSGGHPMAAVKTISSFSVQSFPPFAAGSEVFLKVKNLDDGSLGVILKETSKQKGGMTVARIVRASLLPEVKPADGSERKCMWEYDDGLIDVAPGVDVAAIVVLVKCYYMAKNEEMAAAGL